MDLLKKLIWVIVVMVLFIGLARGIVFVRNLSEEDHYLTYWKEQALTSGNYLYIALGDSTALGIGASIPQKSYVGLIDNMINQTTGKRVQIINLGKSNKTVRQIVDEQLPQLSNYKPDLVTVSVGSNDIKNGTNINTIIQNFKTLILSLPHNSYIAQIPSFGNNIEKQKIIQINSQIKLIATSAGVTVVPIYDITNRLNGNLSYYDFDFFHPNDKGYALWAKSFWDSIAHNNI